MQNTITNVLSPRTEEGMTAATSRASVLALVLLWSREEPARVGEVALFPQSADGRPFVLGRSGGRSDLPRVEWQQQRPGPELRTGPLVAPRISRDQMLVQPLVDRRLALTNIGKLELRLRGAAVGRGIAVPGDLVELADEALMLVTLRSMQLTGRHGALPPFGGVDEHGMVGESPRMWELREQVDFIAARGAHVLIRGPSGTGKELVAQAIHHGSERRGRPLVARNAATIPDTLIDAELFGNARNFPQSGMPERPGLVGEADGSSLFLDEFAEMPPAMQAHLLRVMDHGEYQRLGESRARRADFRLIAATNRPESALKHDVLARLQLRLELPGLGERREDVPLIARMLLRRIAARDPGMARQLFPGGDLDVLPAISARLIAALVSHPYTTHVRELEALLWQALTRMRGRTLDVWDGFAPRWQVSEPEPELAREPEPEPPSRAAAHGSRAVAREAGAGEAVDPMGIPPEEIQRCLDLHDGRQEPVWRELGLASRHVLTRLVKRHGLRVRGRGGA